MALTKMAQMVNPEVMGDMINAKIEALLKLTPYEPIVNQRLTLWLGCMWRKEHKQRRHYGKPLCMLWSYCPRGADGVPNM